MMKVSTITALVLSFAASVAITGQKASAAADDEHSNLLYRQLGYHSQTEMDLNNTVSTTEVIEIKTPRNVLDAVGFNPGFGNSLVPTAPTPLPTPPQPLPMPSTGGLLIPGLPTPNPTMPTPLPMPGQITTATPVPTPIATPMPQVPGSILVPSFPAPQAPTFPTGPSISGGTVMPTGNPAIDILLNPGLVDQWVTLGLKVWQIIISGHPVANVSTQRIAVLPNASIEWNAMENWKGPAAHTYVIIKKNIFGNPIMRNTYTVAYNYGGQLNGRGAFIANATIIPSDVRVSYGWQLDAEAQIGQPVNVGSKDDPVAGIDLSIRWRVSNSFSLNQGTDAFFINGRGEISQINEGATETKRQN